MPLFLFFDLILPKLGLLKMARATQAKRCPNVMLIEGRGLAKHGIKRKNFVKKEEEFYHVVFFCQPRSNNREFIVSMTIMEVHLQAL
jgi:hypothetical protein